MLPLMPLGPCCRLRLLPDPQQADKLLLMPPGPCCRPRLLPDPQQADKLDDCASLAPSLVTIVPEAALPGEGKASGEATQMAVNEATPVSMASATFLAYMASTSIPSALTSSRLASTSADYVVYCRSMSLQDVAEAPAVQISEAQHMMLARDSTLGEALDRAPQVDSRETVRDRRFFKCFDMAGITGDEEDSPHECKKWLYTLSCSMQPATRGRVLAALARNYRMGDRDGVRQALGEIAKGATACETYIVYGPSDRTVIPTAPQDILLRALRGSSSHCMFEMLKALHTWAHQSGGDLSRTPFRCFRP